MYQDTTKKTSSNTLPKQNPKTKNPSSKSIISSKGKVIKDSQTESKHAAKPEKETTDTSLGAKGKYSPERVGIEEEWTSVTLTTKNPELQKRNGQNLAETHVKTFGNAPVFKLETEGGDRGTLCIERITGPLEMEEYNNKHYKDARKHLLNQLSKKGALKQALEKYNSEVGNKSRYNLDIKSIAKEYSISKGSAKVNENRQTNVAIPYSKLGQIPQKGEKGFEEMFSSSEKSDRTMYTIARQEAQKIKEEIVTVQDSRHLQSLLTHIIFQGAKFTRHRISMKEDIKDEHKHHFKVMLKLSQEDVVISILSDEEKQGIEMWLEKGAPKLKDAIKSALKDFPHMKVDDTEIKDIRDRLEKAINARDKGARKLQKVTTAKEESKALDESGDVLKDDNGNEITIKHTHPRQTNRIPVYSHDGEYYMVVEQRAANHMLNTGDFSNNFKGISQFIATQQKVPKRRFFQQESKGNEQAKTKGDHENTSALNKDTNGLFINQTEGDGNCFFHAAYECLHNKQSKGSEQESIRERVRDQLLTNEGVQRHLFGENFNPDHIQNVIASLDTGEWTQDYTAGYVAEALNWKIIIYNPDGSHRYTGAPTESSDVTQTIYMTFTGNHFNSHTHAPLSK